MSGKTPLIPPAVLGPLALAARLVIGGVLIYAGATKAAGPAEEFAYVISAYGMLPPDALPLAARLLPWTELLLGWALLLGWQARAAATAAGALFAVFLFALIGTKARGIELPNCGCFGDGVHFTMSQTIAMDSCLLLLAWVLRGAPASRAALDAWADAGYTRPNAR
jgi:uncharacterized membrane protein YphA (DoxX/SURF4 family)